MTKTPARADATPKVKYLEREYWKTKFLGGGFRNLREAITLSRSAGSDPCEFHVYGVRLLDVMLKHVEPYARRPFGHSTLVEIGCGLGRFTLPLACRFQHVHALDISPKVLRGARQYCRSVPNVTFHHNDGSSLATFGDRSVDYVFTTGVFQHIPQFDIIASYLKDGLRILNEGGVYFFSFQAFFTNRVGHSRQGARITAEGLDRALAGQPYEILELALDPLDPLVHVMALIRKGPAGPNAQTSFQRAPMKTCNYRTGQFEDLPGYRDMVAQWREPIPRMTFHDPDDSEPVRVRKPRQA